MKNYKTFDAVQFAQDENFHRWVKSGGANPELEAFWQDFLHQNPEKHDAVEEATRIIQAIVTEKEYRATEEKQKEIWSRLESAIKTDVAEKKRTIRLNRERRIYRVAASILLFVSVATISWISYESLTKDQASSLASGDIWLKESNYGTSPKTILLSDGSSVILQPASTLVYQQAFSNEKREVKLTGEAFFEVAKDPGRPFLVYADKLVTKVLGTSFTIRAFGSEEKVMVTVKTGKVSVFLESDEQQSKKKTAPALDGVLLDPKEQVVFTKQESRMVKSEAEPVQDQSPAMEADFVFQDVPLADVFKELEAVYGVEIVFDEKAMETCSLNASLEDMPLYDKLRLICKAVGAKYEILDSRIIVTGKGCSQ
jgi:transmembrane sensor